MKRLTLLATGLLAANLSFAGGTLNADTIQKTKQIYTSVEQVPEFPGGLPAFSRYLSKNLRYPDVATLIGINGHLNVSFVVDTNGRIVEATPMTCVGAGCEAEAVRLLEASPVWKPGIQNGKPVRVIYSIPIDFSIGANYKTSMKKLRASDYGFIFNIKGQLYLIDEAEKILGKEFNSDQIQTAEPFYNYEKIEKFNMPDKKEVYLIMIKST